MTTDRLDAILERLGGVLEKSDDDEVRRDVREVQQLIVGVKSDLEDEQRPESEGEPLADSTGSRDGEPVDED